jgi:hypothetical protein
MRILTYIQVLHAYLVNDLLFMASMTGIVGITTLLFRNIPQHFFILN